MSEPRGHAEVGAMDEQEGRLSVSVARKSMHCNGSNWRPGNNTEDTIQILQVWSCGAKGMEGSQD